MDSTTSGPSELVVTLDHHPGGERHHLSDDETWHGDLLTHRRTGFLSRLCIQKDHVGRVGGAVEECVKIAHERLGPRGKLRAHVDSRFYPDFESRGFRTLRVLACLTGETFHIMEYRWPLPVSDRYLRSFLRDGKVASAFCMACERSWGVDEPFITNVCEVCRPGQEPVRPSVSIVPQAVCSECVPSMAMSLLDID